VVAVSVDTLHVMESATDDVSQ